MDKTVDQILLINGLVNLPSPLQTQIKKTDEQIATVINNISFYGYIPSLEMIQSMSEMTDLKLNEFWNTLKNNLEEITGNSKRMSEFVVYKNFPKEVLNKSETEYWYSQILMYFGVPNEFFTENEKPREPLKELQKNKVLHVAKPNSIETIYQELIDSPTKWTLEQKDIVFNLFKKDSLYYLFNNISKQPIDLSKTKFKENIIELLSFILKEKEISTVPQIIITDATDVLRLAQTLSGGDPSLKKPVKLLSFSRKTRKDLLTFLENSNNLLEDMTKRPEMFKKLMKALHPGDYKQFTKTQEAYNKIYTNDYQTFNSTINSYVQNKDPEAINSLITRPGEFLRKFHHMYSIYNEKAVEAKNKRDISKDTTLCDVAKSWIEESEIL